MERRKTTSKSRRSTFSASEYVCAQLAALDPIVLLCRAPMEPTQKQFALLSISGLRRVQKIKALSCPYERKKTLNWVASSERVEERTEAGIKLLGTKLETHFTADSCIP
ncbi:hypothetical protein AVEN_180328-1 [Araneus ventricosus]|uniref:Uncharacterized protein n=1 Tax=Araneus ventricosus TaxID=182803 RepID=A0A4Y2VYY7_ARAVE|nr:hypothetical protein AVEN_180328-1 [Araneus ventricosus]